MPVRAVETMTASRIKISSSNDQAEPDGGQSRFFLAFDVDRDDMAHQILPRRFLLDRVKREAAADASARFDGGEKADSVQAVIEGHLSAFGDQHRLRGHARKERQGQESVSDRATERRLRGG